MSDSVRPHRRQPTRLPRPWDSPGKNTGVGCHFLLQCMKVKSERSRSVLSNSLRPHGLQPTRLLCPWDFPGKSTGVGCHCLLRSSHYKGQIKCLIFVSASVFNGMHYSVRVEVYEENLASHRYVVGKGTSILMVFLIWFQITSLIPHKD